MVLYTCCSEQVARAVVQDRFRLTSTAIGDLTDNMIPRLCEIEWTGPAVDVASLDGIRAAGLPDTYPSGIDKSVTQARGADWHRDGHQSVVCRSASMWRIGWTAWSGLHEAWSELAVFVERAKRRPTLVRCRDDLEWLLPEGLK